MLRNLGNRNKVCYLKKALYDLSQAGREWYISLDEELQKFGVRPSKLDPCIFYSRQAEEVLLMAVYVDDILHREFF